MRNHLKQAVGMAWVLAAAGWAFASSTLAGETPPASGPSRQTAPALEQEAVDFNHPPREYVTEHLGAWTILVEKQLVDEAPDLAKLGLARLERKRTEASAVLPAATHANLQRLTLFLLHGPKARGGGRDNGLEYFRAEAPRYHAWLDPRMGRSIVIYNTENWVALTEFWALKALVHEFAHAQHLEHWPELHPEIYDVWDRARKAGLYREVRPEDRDSQNPNYAVRNHLEYFAELTAMYFVGCDYFPTNRAELKEYDPAGYELVEKLWTAGPPPQLTFLEPRLQDIRMIHYGLFGMTFEPDGIRLAPALPAGWGQVSLQGIRYRAMTLDLQLTGQGRRIASFTLDGRPSPQPFVPGTLTGPHAAVITLAEE